MLTALALNCNNEDDFPDHGDVHENDVWWAAMGVCSGDTYIMGPGDHWEGVRNGRWHQSKTHFRVEWVEGCETEVDKQDMLDPLGNNGGTIGTNSCVQLSYSDRRDCECILAHIHTNIKFLAPLPLGLNLLTLLTGNNKGVGGWRDAGGLQYYMSPQHS